MKKSTIINISGIAFYIEEEAYQKLDTYLAKLNQHFKDVIDKKEIIEDIENRIAEKFSSELKNPQSVVSLELVDRVLESMGMPEDFGDEEVEVKKDDEKAEENVFANRKLFRDPDNKMIGGVISGFVAYFGISLKYLNWIRLGIVIILLLDFMNASWFLCLGLYIFAYLSIPEAISVTDKVEMQGKKITLANIQSTIKADLEGSEKKISRRKKILLFPFRIIAKVLAFIKWFIKYFLSKLIGISMILVSLGTFIAITTLGILIGFFKDSPMIETPLRTFPDRPLEYTAAFLVYLFLLIPILFVIILGASVLKRRYILKTTATLTLIGLWILSFFLGGSLLFNSLPEIKQNFEESRSKNTRSYEVDEFEKIKLNGDSNKYLDVKIIQSNERKIITRGNEGMVKFSVNEKELNIEGTYSDKICVFCTDYREVEIFTPILKDIDVQSYVQLSIEGFKDLDELKLRANQGYSSVQLKNGNAKKFVVELYGSLSAYDFEVNELDINIDNTGFAEVFVKDLLNANINTGFVIYRGSPKVNLEKLDQDNPDGSRVITEKEYLHDYRGQY